MHAYPSQEIVESVSGSVRQPIPSHQVWVGALDIVLHLRCEEIEHTGKWLLWLGIVGDDKF